MKRSNILLTVLTVLCAGIFVFSAYQIGSYYLESRERDELYDGLAALVEDARKELPAENGTEPEADAEKPTTPMERTILPEYAALYERNSDLVGWIKIEDTNVNYPVMQTPENENFYLHADFDRNYNAGGCLYAQENCDVNGPSDNVLIYGHNMKDGSMFANLAKYNDRDFWEEHREISFDTLYEHHVYEIFAVFKTSASDPDGFQYQRFVNGEDEEAFDTFVDTCKRLSFYDTKIRPEYGDKLICLSTCEYTVANGRLVVAAVRKDG